MEAPNRPSCFEGNAPVADKAHHASLRRILGYVARGAIGGAVVALVQRIGPDLLGRPALRWVFLYALLGGICAGGWEWTTRWISVRLCLNRRKTIFMSGLLAGMLLFGTTLLVSMVSCAGGGMGKAVLSTNPAFWIAPEGGAWAFLTGSLAGALWRYFHP